MVIRSAGGRYPERAEIDEAAPIAGIALMPTPGAAGTGQPSMASGADIVHPSRVETSDMSAAMTGLVAGSHCAGRRAESKR
jgi:hypothetical protein